MRRRPVKESEESMPIICVEGIVTRYTNYRENDRIISLFTIEHGRMDAKARGCRRPTSPLLTACQPFVFGQFELFVGKEKATVNACEVKETFYPLREDYERFSAASLALRLCQNAAMENQPNEKLFSLVYHTLSYLAYGKATAYDLLCCFLVRYLNAVGYRPAVTACTQCGRDLRGDAIIRFSPHGGAICNACSQFDPPIGKTALEGMRRMLLLQDDEMDRVTLSDAIRGEILRHLDRYFSDVLDYDESILRIFAGGNPEPTV